MEMNVCQSRRIHREESLTFEYVFRTHTYMFDRVLFAVIYMNEM